MTMTAVSTQLQATQNTAPIVEFSCLYTHDLRRKAKRWHDGLLRYHTFNRRVMVYDLARNIIGDTFNQTGVDLEAGDELELEKDFALVEVSERTAVVQQDLTELNKSRQKKSPKKVVQQTPIAPRSRPTPAIQTQCTPVPAATRHRSLGAMLGTPKGPLGKAVISTTSPYEERQRLAATTAKTPGTKTRHESANDSLQTKQARAALDTPRRRNVVNLCSPEISSHSVSLAEPLSRKDGGANKNASTTTHTASMAAEPAPEATTRDMENATQTRPALRVISNAPRKMLLYQQRTHRKHDTPADVARNEPELQIEGNTTDLDPQQLRLQQRLARIGQRRPRSPVPDPSPPRKQRAIVARGLQRVSSAPSTILVEPPQNPSRPETTEATTTVTTRAPDPQQRMPPPARVVNRAIPAARRTVVEPAAIAALPPTPPKPVDPLDFGPWSREAIDLFAWWPPDRDKAGHKLADDHTK